MRTVKAGGRGFRKVLEEVIRREGPQAAEVEPAVREILGAVRSRGDAALRDYTEKFDGLSLSPSQFRVTAKEVEKAYRQVPRDMLGLLETAAGRIRSFHLRQRQESWFVTEDGGSIMGQLVTPLERVGLYVPGGKAAYPSSVLMNAIPAQVAGVSSLAVCTPAPGGALNPYVLVAADLLGIEEIYRVGGAQAVGALAYGTATIGRVDKIVGPGNVYVATAKKLVYGDVDIDMVAGPSEILVVADGTADPSHVAADLLSQAEHDEMAQCVLVTDSTALAEKVRYQVHVQLDTLPARERARKAIEGYGMIILVKDLKQGFEVSNAVAPEHLEVITENPLAWVPYIRNAGSIFLGEHTPEPFGDYLAGPNHVLPTGGTVRFYSTLGVDAFVKKSNLLCLSREDYRRWAPQVAQFARLEGLEAHARSALSRESGKRTVRKTNRGRKENK